MTRSVASTRPGRRRRYLVGLLAGPATAAALLGLAGPAAADPPQFTSTIGMPNYPADANGLSDIGAVDLRLRTGGGQLLTEEQLGLVGPGQALHDRFGTAVLTGDLDHDGYQDLIVGAPGSPGATPNDVPGRVWLLFGTSTGITGARAQMLSAPAQVGDEFGTALALSSRFEDSGVFTGTRDLWVGVPGHEVGGLFDAGAVFRYEVSLAGVATYRETVTQNSPLVPGVAEYNDRFGAVLAGGSQNGVVVGVPYEDLGRLKNAGTVQHLRTDATTDVLIQAEDWNQNSKGVPGVAESYDQFGAALGPDGRAVGVPGENVGSLVDAGMVQLFGYNYAGAHGLHYVPSIPLTQDSKGIPGKAEAGDHFGAAISDGVFSCFEELAAAIGAPGEDIGKIRDAGSVTVVSEPLYSPARIRCPAKVLSQGSGLPGKAEAGDQLGLAMGVLTGDPFDEETQVYRIQTGVPAEDVGSVPDAGRVITGSGSTATSFGSQAGDIHRQRFGSVFATFFQ